MAVRRETVKLTLVDDFSTGMARAATATALLERSLDNVDGSASRSRTTLRAASTDVDSLGRSTRTASADIDRFSGRLRLMADAAAVLGPGLIPIGAIGIPAVTGLAQQLGFAALAGGTVIASFQGMGEALKSVNKAALEPTAENIQKAQIAMEDLSPAAQDMVTQLRDLVPTLKGLRDTSAEGFLPGLSEGIEGMEQALPRIEKIVEAVSGAMGDIAADAGESIGGERWSEFFDYLATDAPSALADMAAATGNVAHAMSELWMAFDPLNDDFSKWLVDATAGLDKWAQGLSQTQGFADFVDYIRTNGPIVADSMRALGRALLDIVEAAAPLGGPVLKGIEAFSKVISSIADSDLGTPIFTAVAALSALNRVMAISAATQRGMAASGGLMGGMLGAGGKSGSTGALAAVKKDVASLGAVWATAGAQTEREQKRITATTASLKSNLGGLAKEAGRVVGPLAGLGVLTSGAADGMGLTNTATLALMGSMGGVPGVIGGAAVGAFLDLKSASDESADAMDRVNAAIGSTDPAELANGIAGATSELEKLEGFQFPSFGDLFKLDLGRGELESEVAAIESTLKDLENAYFNAVYGASIKSGLGSLGNDMFGPMEQNAAAAARGFELTGASASSAAGGVQAFATAMAAANAAIGKQAAGDAYVANLLQAEKTLAEMGPGLNKFTAAGQANRAMLQGIASSAFKAAEGMKGIGRENSLDRARGDLIGVAMAAGATRAQAQRLADQFGLVDRIRARPQVNEEGSKASQDRIKTLQGEIARTKGKIVNMDEKGAASARARIAAMRAEINSLRDKAVTIATNYVTTRTTINRSIGAAVAGMTAIADGGTVPGPRYPYADKVYAFLAPGEEVITNRAGEADRYRADRAAGRIPAYADGGTVQSLADGGRARKGKSLSPDQRANRGFDIGGLGLAGTRKELRAFEKAIRRSGGRLGKNFDGLSKRILRNAGEYQQLGRQMKAARESQKSAAEAARGAFDNDAFGGTAADLRTQLAADRNDSRAVTAALGRARAKGLKGNLGGDLAGSGNLALAQEFAKMSRAEIASYQSLYVGRTMAQNDLGRQTSSLYAKELRESNRERAAIRRTLNGLERSVERGARAGTRGQKRVQATRNKAKGKSR